MKYLFYHLKIYSGYHDKIGSHCSSLAKFEKISKMVLAEIENIFSHGACLNASFLANDHYTTSAKVEFEILCDFYLKNFSILDWHYQNAQHPSLNFLIEASHVMLSLPQFTSLLFPRFQSRLKFSY